MFTSEFKENINGEATLHEKKFEDIIELLKLIYPNYEKTINGKRKLKYVTSPKSLYLTFNPIRNKRGKIASTKRRISHNKR